MRRKSLCYILAVTLLVGFSFINSHAETNGVMCSHLAPREYVQVHANWRPLSVGSPEYAVSHTRDWYLETRCSVCGHLFMRELMPTEWGSHYLPCSLCGAGW